MWERGERDLNPGNKLYDIKIPNQLDSINCAVAQDPFYKYILDWPFWPNCCESNHNKIAKPRTSQTAIKYGSQYPKQWDSTLDLTSELVGQLNSYSDCRPHCGTEAQHVYFEAS